MIVEGDKMENNNEMLINIRVPKNNDTAYRDTMLKAYTCAVLDLYVDEFDKCKELITTSKGKKIFIERMMNDLECRLDRIIDWK